MADTSGVQFDEDTSYDVIRPASATKKKRSVFAEFVIQSKLAKDEAEANRVLLVFGIVCLALAVAIYLFSNPPQPPIGTPSIVTPDIQERP